MEQEKTYRDLARLAYNFLQGVKYKNKVKADYAHCLKGLVDVPEENLPIYLDQCERVYKKQQEIIAICTGLEDELRNLTQPQQDIVREITNA